MFLLFHDSFTLLSLLQFLSSSDIDFRLLCSPRVLVAMVLPSINDLTKPLLVHGVWPRDEETDTVHAISFIAILGA